MGDSEAAWLSWRPPPAGETPPGRSRATAISRASSANLPCFAGGRVRTRRASETSSALPLSVLLPLPLPLPGGRETALGCPLLVYLLRTGDPKKTRRNPPKSAVITPQPHGARRSTCPCVIKDENTRTKKKISSNSRRSSSAAQENASWRAERRRCGGRWGSQREQTEHLHPKPRLWSRLEGTRAPSEYYSVKLLEVSAPNWRRRRKRQGAGGLR